MAIVEHDIVIRGGGFSETVSVRCHTCGFYEVANSEYEQALLRAHDRRAEA